MPNFVDCETDRRTFRPDLRRRYDGGDERMKIVMHMSNFRPVKRLDTVMAVFDRIRRQVPARLVLVGDGPELEPALEAARIAGISELVYPVGTHEEVLPLLSIADVFLLPSSQESFGLAALEAMACEAPVVASDVGGLPEVIEHGVSGFLHAPDDVAGMTGSALAVLTDAARHRQITDAALARVHSRFCLATVVPMYEAVYRDVMR